MDRLDSILQERQRRIEIIIQGQMWIQRYGQKKIGFLVYCKKDRKRLR